MKSKLLVAKSIDKNPLKWYNIIIIKIVEQILGGVEIAESIQNGDKSNTGAKKFNQ